MENSIVIRPETASDHNTVRSIVQMAFQDSEHSNGHEHVLVDALRDCDAYVPQLALVAVNDGCLVGFVMMSRITISGHDSLALAPVAVLPQFQGCGIGSALIREAHRRAVETGYVSSVVLGHKDYYPRFGYRPLAGFGLSLPWDVPGEYCMAAELVHGSLTGVKGMVTYPQAFFE